MSENKIARIVRGTPAVDGAGVHLVRVLGPATITDFDPFLMLDSFDSKNPQDYIAGFPMHPHRGIETVTFLANGRFIHEDTLGNKGEITGGSLQWMTAGSGILHQEMPQPADRLLGFQLWLNLPKSEKMTSPKYFDIHPEDKGEVQFPGGKVQVISGKYGEASGVKPHHIQANFFDFFLEPDTIFSLPLFADQTNFIFTLLGDSFVNGTEIKEKSAVLFEEADHVEIKAGPAGLRFQHLSAPALKEQVAWGGPIVMNTREEVMFAFDELRNGIFIK